jgi:hypothetical protein
VTPIAVGPLRAEDWPMVQLAIRCHPCVPVSADELEGWLEHEVSDLRLQAPHGTIRLSRLTLGPSSGQLYNGWLIELELAEGEPLLSGDRLTEALRDMHLLGLQPSLLAPTPRGSVSPSSPVRGSANGGRS